MSMAQNYILKQVSEKRLSPEEAKQLLMEMKSQSKAKEDIAVIGISCRLPNAENTEEYWNNLMNALDCKVPYQKEMVDYIKPIVNNKGFADFMGAQFLTEEEAEDNKLGGYLKDVDKFDAELFGISPKEAKTMDPSHRVLLETVWTAIEDAGYAGEKIYGSNTSLFVGKDHVNDTYYRYVTEEESTSMTGNWPGLMAGRVSYLLNLKGGAMVIDSACSSGLLGVHLACNALNNKDSEIAIVSAISLGIFPRFTKSSKSIMESQDDRVKAFDQAADGTFFSDGAAAVILKPLNKALQDGDNIYGVIKGSAVNNDGASNGLTAPNAAAQEEVLVKAWENAQIAPETIQYIEAHGTGTKLGDPIEVKGLTNAFAKYTDKLQFCGIGSVKSNIGHTVAVSGLASLIKIVLSLRHNVIPSSINFKEPNSLIHFIKSPLFVTEEPMKWEKGSTPRRAGINSFGFVGTNAHVIIEEPPVEEIPVQSTLPYEIFTLSAKTEQSLHEMLKAYRSYFQKKQRDSLQHICYTANTGRGHYEYRLALVVQSVEELAQKINDLCLEPLRGNPERRVYYAYHKIGSDHKQVMDKGEIGLSENRKMSHSTNQLIEGLKTSNQLLSDMEDICNSYVKGAKVQWQLLYKGEKRRIVSLPSYRFNRTAYWGEIKDRRAENLPSYITLNHPLIDQCLVDSMDEVIYCTTFNADTHWVLSDHKIKGVSVIPGTTYLEMGRKACAMVLNSDKLELKDVLFFNPLHVKPNENKLVHIIVKKEKVGTTFVIASKDDQQWTTHAEGKAFKLEERELGRFDISTFKKGLDLETFKVNYKDDHLSSNVFTFGPRWLNFKEVVVGQDEQLAELELSAEYAGDLIELALHPALLDNAVNLFIGEDDDGSTFLPFSYKNVKVYAGMPRHFYVHAQKKSSNSETKTCDIQLIDPNNQIFAEIKDYVLKKVNHWTMFQDRPVDSSSYYKINWIPSPLEPKQNISLNGSVLLFQDEQGLHKQLIERLGYEDQTVIRVGFGEVYEKMNDHHYIISGTENDYLNLVTDIKNQKNMAIGQIIHMSSFGGTDQTYEDVERVQTKGLYSLFHLVRSLSSNKIKNDIDFIIISDCSTEVTGNEGTLNPHSASLFGFGSVVTQEFKNLRCRAIDIEQDTSVDMIADEIVSLDKDYHVALRENQRYVAELSELQIQKPTHEGMRIADNGVYIITGGTGGIGLVLGNYLASKTKVRLALINRTPLPEAEKWDSLIAEEPDGRLAQKLKAIRNIQRAGSEVSCYSADIHDFSKMSAVVEDIKTKYDSIQGVFHCAGVAGDGFIFRKQKDVFDEVVKPKVNGTWLMDYLTKDEHLDFFVLFSSINAVFGGPGQGDYVAANAYMDSFACARNKRGKNTIAINWPAWGEVGIAADYGIKDDASLFRLLTVRQALSCLEEIMGCRLSNVIPGTLNKHILQAAQDSLPFAISSKIKDELLERPTPKREAQLARGDKVMNEVVMKGKGDEYTETEKIISQMYSAVLDMNELDLYESFSAMGGDSIMATHLLKMIDSQFPGVVDISDIFTYSSVVELSEYIDQTLGSQQEEPKEQAQTEKDEEQELRDLIKSLQQGSIDIEDGLKLLEK